MKFFVSCEKLLKQYKNATIKIYIYSGLRRRRSHLFLIFIPKSMNWNESTAEYIYIFRLCLRIPLFLDYD